MRMPKLNPEAVYMTSSSRSPGPRVTARHAMPATAIIDPSANTHPRPTRIGQPAPEHVARHRAAGAEREEPDDRALLEAAIDRVRDLVRGGRSESRWCRARSW